MNKIFTLLLVGALTAGAVTANAESQIFKKKKKYPNFSQSLNTSLIFSQRLLLTF